MTPARGATFDLKEDQIRQLRAFGHRFERQDGKKLPEADLTIATGIPPSAEAEEKPSE